MKQRSIKIIVDLLMTLFLILSFVRWEGDPTFHFIVGSACTLFFAIHICIHRKWLQAVTKSCLQGKLKPGLRGKYIVDMLLLAIWTFAIVTGFLAIAPFVGEAESMAIFGRMHGVTSRLGLVLVVVHVIQHRKQIISYCKKKQKQGGSYETNH